MCRRLKLKGHSFREFLYEVVPLLDGTRSTEEIQQLVSDTFAPEDLSAALELLASEGLLEDQDRGVPPAPEQLEHHVLREGDWRRGHLGLLCRHHICATPGAACAHIDQSGVGGGQQRAQVDRNG